MGIEWKLEKLLQREGITSAKQLQEALKQTSGICISHQALHKLTHQQPSCLRLETAQYLCNLLQVPLESILAIEPEALNPKPGMIIQPYGPKQPVISVFTDPREFFK